MDLGRLTRQYVSTPNMECTDMTDDNGNDKSGDRRDMGSVLRECHEKEAFNFALF